MSEYAPDEESSELVPAYRDTFVHFLFGSPSNEPLLLHFINAVLESDGQAPAKSVEMRNPFNPQPFITDKFTILDVKATDEQGVFALPNPGGGEDVISITIYATKHIGG